jgi:nucleotide-binding universal stress UspA family protein
MKRIRNILHPTDFSPGSDAAFRYACDLALDYDASLIVVYAQGPVVPIAAEGILVSNNLDELREAAERQLNAIRPVHPAVRFERVYREGPATEVILETADEYKADLIVMGTHGRSGIGRQAACPVLTVKAQRPARSEKSGAFAKRETAGTR